MTGSQIIIGKNVAINVGGSGKMFPLKGSISFASDFPTPEEVQNNWTYKILENVIDNDPTKTNTDQSFNKGDIIAWGESEWVDITGIEVVVDDGTVVKTINSRDIDLQSKGLKDANVSTAVKLGDTLNTVFNTTNKTIIGAVNEVNSKSSNSTISLIKANTFSDLSSITDLTNNKIAYVIDTRNYYKYNSSTLAWEIYFDKLPWGASYYVDPNHGSDTLYNGSIDYPFKTIAKAVSMIVSGGEAAVIFILDSIAENITITGTTQNIQFCGVPTVLDSQVVKWIGKVIISGSTTRLKFKDLQINHATDCPVEISSTQGRMYFDNITFTRDDSSVLPVVKFTGTNYRWHEFYNCNLTGVMSLEGSPSSYCDIRITGIGAWEEQINMAGTTDNYNVRVINAARLGLITHTRGYLCVENVNEMQATGGVCVASTANTSTKNKMILRNVALKKHDTNVYGKINKTGTCDYVIDNCDRDTANDVLTGNRRDYGSHAMDMSADYTPSIYSPDDNSIKGNLSGIDTKLSEAIYFEEV